MKVWYRSRTLIINMIAAALIALEASTQILQPLVPVNIYATLAVVLAVVNAVLRVITTQALVVRCPPPADGDAQ